MGYAFISYSTKDLEYVKVLHKLLSEHGIETWIAPGDIPAGSTYAGVIVRAIKGSECLVLLLTEHAQNSKWVDKEVERALSFGKIIIPIALESIQLNDNFEFYLGNQQIIPVRQFSNENESMLRLIQQIQSITNAKTNCKQQQIGLDKNVEQEFANVLEKLCNYLNDFSKSFSTGDLELFNATSRGMDSVIKEIAYYMHAHSEIKRIADSAKSIIEHYNSFVVSVNQWVEYSNTNNFDIKSQTAQASWQMVLKNNKTLFEELIYLLNNEFRSKRE